MLSRIKQNKPLVRGSLLALPFQDNSFVNGFSVDVLIHIRPQDRARAIKELSRVSKNAFIFSPANRTIFPVLIKMFLSRIKNRFLIKFLLPGVLLLSFFYDRVL